MQVKLKDCKTFFKIFTYFRKGNLSTVKVSEKSRSPAIAEASILEVPANSYLFWTNRDTIEVLIFHSHGEFLSEKRRSPI